jgi:hypothetical protein
MTIPVNVFAPQVTRIPIGGPAPYNTLVVVSGWNFIDSGSSYGPTHNVFHFPDQLVITPFILQGFDQRVPPVFDHSTSVSLTATGPSKNDDFLFAVDTITGAGFTPDNGTFYVTVATTIEIPDEFIPQGTVYGGGYLVGAFLNISSYVLVYEPPIAANPGDGHAGIGRTRPRTRVPHQGLIRHFQTR